MSYFYEIMDNKKNFFYEHGKGSKKNLKDNDTIDNIGII